MRGSNQRVVLLQPRDRKLLEELAIMRVIDREQAKTVAGFASTTRANTRLLALTHAGFLKRTFVGTISGGRKAVYRLSRTAVATLSAASPGGSDHAGKGSYSELFLEHQMQVNQVYLWVKHKPIPLVGCQFHRWISFTRMLSKISPIIPDGYFELQHESVVKALFLEVDMGTEALRIWQKKIEGYLKFAVSGEFGKLFSLGQFKVIVIANSERRAESIRKVTAKFTDKIFRFTSFQTINSEGFWSPIWARPTGDQKESLV
jgi:Replication-relaxation